MNLFKTILERLRQPSTQVGLSAIGVLVGLPPGTIDLVGQIIVAGVALVGVLTDEKKTDAK